MKMVLGVVRLEMAIDFGSKEVEPMLDEGVVHGQPMYCYGTVKNSSDCLLDQNGPCEIACMWLLDMRGMNDVGRIKLLLL